MLPKRFDRVTDDQLRACGLSAGKVRFLRDLVAKAGDGTVPLAELLKQLDAFRQSLSWRWMAPVRAVYSLLQRLGPRTKDQGRTKD